jgi:hypothetical protein
MLKTAEHNKIKSAMVQALDLLSVPAVWTQTKSPNATLNIQVGFKNAGRDDTEIINSYGLDAIIITMKADDFTTRPEKFDTLTIDGVDYTLDEVRPHRLNGEVVFLKSIIRGDV